MGMWLKQSISVDVGIGPFVDNVDGYTAESGLTLTQPDIRLKKNSGNWAQKNAAQTLSHEENGWYELTLDATDTNTLGILLVSIQESGALPVWHEFQVITANIYDSLIGGGDLLDTNTAEWKNATVPTPTFSGYPQINLVYWRGQVVPDTVAAGHPMVDVHFWRGGHIIDPDIEGVPKVDVIKISDGIITSGTIAVDAIGASELAADAANEIADAILKRDMSAVSGEAARSLINAIRKLMNKWSISGTVLTVTKEDDATTAFTQNITSTPNADAITGLDTV